MNISFINTATSGTGLGRFSPSTLVVLTILSPLFCSGRTDAAVRPYAAPGADAVAHGEKTGLSLQLHNAVPVPREAWPVTAGVPLARGQMPSGQRPVLLGPDTRLRPLQSRVLSRWEDGSAKWLLLDFQADVAPLSTVRYTLRFEPQKQAAPHPPAAGILVRESPDAIVVNTGVLRFRVSRRKFEFISGLQVNRNGKWQTLAAPGAHNDSFVELEHQPPGAPQEENWLRRAAGSPRDRYTAAADAKIAVSIEENGPLRTTLRIDTWHVNQSGRRFLPLTLRLSAFAGSALLRVHHTVVFTGEPKQDFIRSLGLGLQLSGGLSAARFGSGFGAASAGAATEVKLAPHEWAGLCQIGPEKFYHDVPYTVDKRVQWSVTKGVAGAGSGVRQVAAGMEAPGWLSADTNAGPVTVAVRDFRHQHPSELRVDGQGRLTVYLWPDQGERVLDLRRRYDYVENEKHYDLTMWEYGGLGVGKTQEFWYDFGAAQSPVSGAHLSACIDEPLYAMPEPNQVLRSGVFGALQPRNPERYPRLEAYQDFGIAWIRRNQQAFRWDGWLDYGDALFLGYGVSEHWTTVRPDAWASRGYAGWLNDDGGLCHTLFLQALRSGDRTTMKMAEVMTRHVMDVDVCHYCPPAPQSVGGGHRHDQQHFGNGVRGYGTATHGVIDYYLLFGDGRARDVARETAEFHLHPVIEDEDDIGGLWRAYEIFGDTRYRDGALAALRLELTPGSPAEYTARVTSGPVTWPFLSAPAFRFVTNSSTNLALLRASSHHPELDAAIIKAMQALKTTQLSSWREHGVYRPLLLSALAYDISNDTLWLQTSVSMLRDIGIFGELDARKLWPDGLDALSFERMVEISKLAGINNIYSLQLNGLGQLPYVLHGFARAGVSEADIDSFMPVNDKPDPFEETLDNARFMQELGHCYLYVMQNRAPSDINGGHSTLRLYEDGREMLQAHAPHPTIRQEGGGRWSHWGTTLYISASDNSDPRTNGRKYRVVQE